MADGKAQHDGTDDAFLRVALLAEDAHDRKVARSFLGTMRSEAMADMRNRGHTACVDALGPPTASAEVRTTFFFSNLRPQRAALCIALEDDGLLWRVYRYDHDRHVPQRHVGLKGNPWNPTCAGVGCGKCCAHEYGGHDDGAAAIVAPTAMDPFRWPIGICWTWTDADLETHLVDHVRTIAWTLDAFDSRAVLQSDKGTLVGPDDFVDVATFSGHTTWATVYADDILSGSKRMPSGDDEERQRAIAEARLATARLSFVVAMEVGRTDVINGKWGVGASCFLGAARAWLNILTANEKET